jgi:UDP-2,3-diacylglucosamine pyrophosphatase LpxH
MITTISERRLLVTSDPHVGNLFVNARANLVRLLDYASREGYAICINGDGIDVLHTSLNRITTEGAALLRELRRISEKTTIYYTVGNHDLILEHYLGDWGGIRLVPFLNLHSGDKRIRIEHGHLYDHFMMNHPDLQPALTRFLGWVCRCYPPWYTWEEKIKVWRYRRLPKLLGRSAPERAAGLRDDECPAFFEAAEEIAQRGFDAVVFGHTHHVDDLPLNEERARYYNTGCWARNPHYLTIDDGRIELKPWNGHA